MHYRKHFLAPVRPSAPICFRDGKTFHAFDEALFARVAAVLLGEPELGMGIDEAMQIRSPRIHVAHFAEMSDVGRMGTQARDEVH